MKTFVGVTDGDWFELLSRQENLTEINFWQPGGSHVFRALEPGEIFLFKLHSPKNFIVGGGFFAYSTLLPVSLAWETFEVGNGALSIEEIRQRIEFYRRRPADRLEDYTIGCIILQQPFFLSEEQWIPIPTDWKPNIVQGRTYDSSTVTGRLLFDQVRAALAVNSTSSLARHTAVSEAPGNQPRFGDPLLVLPRLGQGAFRILVTDVYSRRCAVTHERTLPALEAAHIRPYGEGGEHRVDNGLLLRRDLHTLFDRGYVTVTPDYRVEVSRRIREEFENGKEYYALQGREIFRPAKPEDQPSPEFLRWHNEARFRA